ncbi:MAG: hypothetical protein ACOC3T_02185 [Bacteroidota bacterium]
MKKILLFVLLLAAYLPVKADCDTLHTRYAVSPEDQKYLTYLHYNNTFDSASTTYKIGEIRTISGNDTAYHNIHYYYFDYQMLVGIPDQGVDTLLQQFGHTEDLTYSDGAKLKFYRLLNCDQLCGEEFDPEGDDIGGTGDWRADYWRVGRGTVLDRTEWVLQMVDAQTDSVLAVLDSVGVAPNPNSALAQRYGTDPDYANHEADLPEQYENRRIYLRISPRRYGPTPYGMDMNFITIPASLSTYYEISPNGFKKTTSQCDSLLREKFFDYLIDYCDSMFVNYGHLGGGLQFAVFAEGKDSIINNRYFNIDTVLEGGQIIWKLKAPPYGKKRLPDEYLPPYRDIEKIEITGVGPNPIRNSDFEIKISCANIREEAEVILLNISGDEYKIWGGVLDKASNVIRINLEEQLYQGVYTLCVRLLNGKAMDCTKIVIER